MKKALSLFLALIVIVLAVCGLAMAADKPTESTNATTAAVKVVTAGGETAYFDTLNSDVAAWAAEEAGGATITLLKDLSLGAKVTFPVMSAENPVVLDLNGYTMTNSGAYTGIVLNGNAVFTIKNGIFKQTGAANAIMISETSAGNNDGAGNYYTATVNFDKVYVHNSSTAAAGCVVESKYTDVTFNITDSVLWADHVAFQSTFNMENNVFTTVVATGSVVGNADTTNNRVFRIAQLAGQAQYNLNVTATDTVFASGDGSIGSGTRNKVNGWQWGAVDTSLNDYVNAGAAGNFVTGSATCTALSEYTFTAPDGTVLSAPKAAQFGTAFTAVDWAADAPAQCDPADAVVSATVSGNTYYFASLNSDVVAWAANCIGGAELELLQNYTLAAKVEFPALTSSNPVVLDLNGYTLTNAGAYTGIVLKGNADFTIKNGAFKQTGDSNAIMVSETTAGNNDGGYYYNATLSFENAFVHNTSTADIASIVESKFAYLTINVTDSLLWADHTHWRAVFRLENCDVIYLNVTDSVVGSNCDSRIMSGTAIDGDWAGNVVNIKPSNSIFASSTGAIASGMRHNFSDTFGNYAASGTPTQANLVANNAATAVTPFSFTAPDGSALANTTGTQFGTAPTAINYPFTVTYDANTGTGAPAAVYSTTGAVTVANGDGMTKDGYVFTGWNTQADGNGTAVTAGASQYGTTTLYAQWAFDASADAPTGVDQAAAAFKVVASGNTFYYAELSSDVLNWAVTIPGGVEITMLKNVALTSTITFPATWNDANPIVLDLGGYKLTSSAANVMILVSGHGNLTIKNGFIYQTGAAPAIQLAVSGAQTDTSSAYYLPTLVIENALVHSTASGANMAAIQVYSTGADITLNNSTLWTTHGTEFRGVIETASNLASGTTAERTTYVRLNNSIMGGACGRVIRKNADSGRVDVYPVNSTIITNKYVVDGSNSNYPGAIIGQGYLQFVNGTQYGKTAFYPNVTGSQQNLTWSGKLPDGTSVSGIATYFGTEVTQTTVPFTVSYNANGGTGSVSAQESNGASVSIAAGTALSNSGYMFAGWNTSADGNGTAYVAGDSYTGTSITLYAQWVVDTTANAPEGVEESAATYKVSAGGKTFYYADLSSDVLNWVVTVPGGVEITLLKDVTVTTPITFPATWDAANPVTLNLGGFKMSSSATNAVILVSGWGDLTIKNGYIYHSAVAPTLQLGVDGAQTDTNGAYYVPVLTIENALIFDTVAANNSTTAGIIRVFTTGADITVNDSTVWSNCGTEFRGFIECAANLASGSGTTIERTTYIRVNNSIMGGNIGRVVRHVGSANTGRVDVITNNATFVFKAYNLSAANPQGTLGNSGFMFVNGTQYSGTTSTYPNVAGSQLNESWTGTLPDGTSVSGAAVYFGTLVTNTTVPFTVKYDANGGTGDVPATEESSGASVTVAAGTGLTMNGYVFAGWNTAANGSGTAYVAGDSISASATLYAQWATDPAAQAPTQAEQATATYKITFNDDSSKVFYYDALNSEVLSWAVTVPGGVEIDLLKDVTLTATIAFPATWNASYPIVLDLNGYTITNGAASIAIQMLGNGDLTIKNGTINNAQTAATIQLGDGTTRTYNPTLTLNKVFVNHAESGSTAYVTAIAGYVNDGTINIQSSVLYSAKTAYRGVIELSDSTVSSMYLNISDSILYASGVRVMRGDSQGLPVLTTTNSAFVSKSDGGANGQLLAGRGNTSGGVAIINGVAVDTAGSTGANESLTTAIYDSAWTGTLPNGVTVSGYSSSFDTAPTSVGVPFRVTYNANGATEGTAPDAVYSENGESVIIAAGSSMTKEGYIFSGWNTAADGNGTAYLPGDVVTSGATLYANWAEKPDVEAPDQVDSSEAGIVVELLDASKYYFATLTSEVVNWASAQPGGATITVLKNLTLAESVIFPAEWDAANAIVIDMDGNTITNSVDADMFIVSGNGDLTIKNGYLINDNTANIITLGVSGSYTAGDGTYYLPTLTLEKMLLKTSVSGTAYGAIANYMANANVYVNDSTIWASNAVNYQGAIVVNVPVQYYNFCIYTDNSIIGGTGTRAFRYHSGSGRLKIYPTNTAFVTKASGDFGSDQAALISSAGFTWINDVQTGANSVAPTVAGSTLVNPWSGKLPDGTAVTGAASVFGTAPTQTNVPYTVVYNANGATGSLPANVYSSTGVPVTVGNANNLFLNGHYFVGWNTASDGSGKYYLAGSTISTNATLYAQWRAIPVQVDEAEAGVKVTTITGDVYYYATLDSDIAEWAVNQAGGVTITVLKDLTLEATKVQTAVLFPIYWDESVPVVIDFAGHKVSSAADYMIATRGDANLTLKNGYLYFTGINNLISLGRTGTDRDLIGEAVNPTLNLVNMVCYNANSSSNTTGIVIGSKFYNATINITNSTLWGLNPGSFYSAIFFELGTGYTTYLNVTDSIIGGTANRSIRNNGGALQLTVENSAFVSTTGVVATGSGSLDVTCGETVTSGALGKTGAEAGGVLNETWTGEMFNGTALSGIATVYGEAPDTTLITTAVAEVGGVQYTSLAEAIANANGGTVNLLADCSGPALVIDASVTINFAGYTYTVTTPDGSSYAVEVTGASTVVTLKDGGIKVDSANAASYDVLVMNTGATLTITDMDLDGTNLDKNAGTGGHYSYVLSNEDGTVALNGATNLTANDEGNAFAFDVCGSGEVSISTTGTITGAIYVDDAATLEITNGTYTQCLDNEWAADGYVPVSYANGTYGVTQGTIKFLGHSLSLDEIVYVNHYVQFTGFSVDVAANGGLLIWNSEVSVSDANINNAAAVNKQNLIFTSNVNGYGQQTDGVPAAEYGSKLYLRSYLKLADGSYAYGPLKVYSVRQYCESRLANSSNENLKNLCAALLNFGAAAQTEFEVNLDDLANSNVNRELAAWNDSMLDALKAVNTSITATGDVTANGKSLSLEDKIYANFYYVFNATVKNAELLVWDGVNEMLSDSNVSYRVTMSKVDGEYGAQTKGFASTEYGKTIFVCAKFVDANDAVHYSEVVAYSPEAFAANKIGNVDTSATTVELCKTMVLYGEYAKAYFGR